VSVNSKYFWLAFPEFFYWWRWGGKEKFVLPKKKALKLSRYRPGQALGFPGG
jgi:hypothetical protein